MKQSEIEKFEEERRKLNEIVMKYGGKSIKRFYNLDWQVYEEKALSKKTKELLGLVSSLVLRCDACIKYHIIQCHREGVRDKELKEALSVGLIVGGSIVIPHLREAFKVWDELKN